jgi:hypothetical protein
LMGFNQKLERLGVALFDTFHPDDILCGCVRRRGRDGKDIGVVLHRGTVFGGVRAGFN